MKQITENQIEARINEVFPGWRSDGEWTGKAYSYRAGVEYAIEQMQPEWINVKDRLPEIGQMILFCYNKEVSIVFVDSVFLGTNTVVYDWQPLPDPPNL